MNLINFCTGTIKYSFYAIFFFVPLIFAGNTSELFELNKMWFAWAATIIIMLAWSTKMILEKRIFVQRTPLDIPLLLFLLSQTIATLFSLDPQVSWWGYYSRFNGGLLSTITYVLLYYAFVSNLSVKNVLKLLKVTLAGAILTALWGFPSHYGADPTCLVFRGTFDISCWTYAFQPTVRVFSTLGQPAWFAAYLGVLIPLILAYALIVVRQSMFKFGIVLAIAMLFYGNLIFTNTRAGFLGFVAAIIVFWIIIFVKRFFTRKLFLRYFLIINSAFIVSTFVFGFPLSGAIHNVTLPGLQTEASKEKTTVAKPAETAQPTTETQPASAPTEVIQPGITDSGNIRKYVWHGAIDAWKSSPLFGTGVETFAFAYYKFRPVGHNLTSEWDYLYNKAHNEYLNYLTTTGLFGLGSYLAFIGLFIFYFGKWFWNNGKWQMLNEKDEKNQQQSTSRYLLTIGLFSGWISILITNFFGFSVVIMNIFLFMIPLFVFMIKEALPDKTFTFGLSNASESSGTNPYQWTAIVLFTLFSGYLLIGLYQYWYADTKYALGSNLDHVGSYKEAYPLLLEAVQIKPNESVYKDELAINVSVLATALAQNNDSENAGQFASNAITLNDEVINKHPNNVVYWKNRVRLFYTLAQAVAPEQQLLYYQEALKAIQHASELAPTDAKISYNLGVLYGQTGNIPKGIEILNDTIKLKPDYKDPYFALGLFYRQSAVNENNRVIHPELNQKAIAIYEDYLKRFEPNNIDVKKSLEEWKNQ